MLDLSNAPLTNNMARKSITYWHCCCKPRPLFMRLVNLTYQLLHYIYIHFRTGFFLAMFSVSETPEDAIHFFEGAVTRMTILGSHVADQIPSLKFRSWLYRRSPHHHSTNSYEPIRFLQTSQNRLINIHRKSLKHISQSALFGFSKNIGHDQIWYENSVVFKAVQWLFMIKERSCKLCYIVDSLVKT